MRQTIAAGAGPVLKKMTQPTAQQLAHSAARGGGMFVRYEK
jgi:hypothetical protein